MKCEQSSHGQVKDTTTKHQERKACEGETRHPAPGTCEEIRQRIDRLIFWPAIRRGATKPEGRREDQLAIVGGGFSWTDHRRSAVACAAAVIYAREGFSRALTDSDLQSVRRALRNLERKAMAERDGRTWQRSGWQGETATAFVRTFMAVRWHSHCDDPDLMVRTQRADRALATKRRQATGEIEFRQHLRDSKLLIAALTLEMMNHLRAQFNEHRGYDLPPLTAL